MMIIAQMSASFSKVVITYHIKLHVNGGNIKLVHNRKNQICLMYYVLDDLQRSYSIPCNAFKKLYLYL